MTTTNPDLTRVQEQFRRQADAYERMASVSDRAGHAALVAFSGARPNDRVLDVACGPGFLTMAFAERVASVVGVDGTDRFLDDARRESRRRGVANVRFVLGDVERLPLSRESFDVVACRAAFHHFPRPAAALAEMARVAKASARFVIADQVASEDEHKATLHNEIERLCDPTHARALSQSQFERLFESNGLRVAVKRETRIDYTVREWMSHGGPSPENARLIEEKMRAAIDGDRAGLSVREENGELAFTHTAVAFVVERG